MTLGGLSYIDLVIYILLGIAFIGVIIAVRKILRSKQDLATSEFRRSELTQGEERIFEFLHHLGLSINENNTHQNLYKVIVEGVCKVTKAEGGALYLYNADTESFTPAHLSAECAQLVADPDGDSDPDQELLCRYQVNKHDGVLGHVLDTNAALYIDDLRGHATLSDQLVKYSGKGSAMLSPLNHAGEQIGVLAVTHQGQSKSFTKNDLGVFSIMAEQSSFAIGNFEAHDQAAEKRRLEKELENAQEVQRVLIPVKAPEVSGFNFYGYNLAAKLVSGDYFDYTTVSANTTGVVIADVSGKGMPAGLIMATFRSALRAIAKGAKSPSESLSELNRMIFKDVREDMFISAIYTHLDHKSGKVKIARAGHNPAYYWDSKKEELSKIKSPGLAVGIDEGSVFDSILKDHELKMKSGDKVFLYTDGIIEANNSEKVEYSAERLEAELKENAHLSARALGKRILASIDYFVEDAPQSDDITLVVIERE